MHKLLVVEDEHDWRTLLRMALTNAGYECILAASGQEALAALAVTTDISAVLVDLEMPGMAGVDVATAINRAVDTQRLTATIVGLTTLHPTLRVDRHAVVGRRILRKDGRIREMLAALQEFLPR